MKSLRLLTINALALLFLLMQQASVVHAAEHDFHKKEIACDAFIAAEKQKVDDVTAALTVLFTVSSEITVVSLQTPDQSEGLSLYHPRAPPAHIA